MPAQSVQPIEHRSHADIVVSMWLVTIYVLLIMAGFSIFRSRGTMVGGNEMSVPRALFTSVNAITLTGFRQSTALEQIRPRGQICVAVLMLCGTFLTLSISTLAVVRILRLRWKIWQVFGAALLAQILSAFIGGVFLLGGGRDFLTATFQAASAFSNFGLSLGQTPDARDGHTLFVLLPLSVIGGLGLPVLMDLCAKLFFPEKHTITSHTKIVLSMTGIVFVFALAVGVIAVAPDSISRPAVESALATDLVATLNARGSGASMQAVYAFPRTLQTIVMVLMLIGAAPASTGGGIKITTLYAIMRGGDRSLRGEKIDRMLGIALAWLAIYLLLVFSATLWLLSADPQLSFDRVLFNAISAASNIGLSHDPLGITRDNTYALCITMLLGRLLPIGVLWWMALSTRDADVAVG